MRACVRACAFGQGVRVKGGLQQRMMLDTSVGTGRQMACYHYTDPCRAIHCCSATARVHRCGRNPHHHA